MPATATTLIIVLLLAACGIAAGLVFGLRRRLVAEARARKIAEERLASVLEYTPVAMSVVRKDGTVEHINHNFRKLFGYGPEELRTVEDWWPRAYPDPEYRAQAIAIGQQMVSASRETCSESEPKEMRVTCRDGTVKEIEFHYVDLNRIGLWTMIDNTDHHRTEEAARLANDHLLSQLSEIGRLQEALREQAMRDPLTTLFNRRYLDETLEREIARAMREGYPLTVMMLDIDHFKKLNDTYGHLAGDEMLKVTGQMFASHARLDDVICRFGGEEFAIVLPRMSLETARLRAESWRQAFAETTVTFGTFSLQATLSAGISAFPEHGKTRDELLEAADLALYRAKRNGRNRVELASTKISD
ncbi:MAG: hypothetical protein QG584_724 [Pseudomonadota bacterium]|nr:hypothetical protein [Pseudomonadota bacterium]MDQ5914840.1 hypothetical protein [Pseudomonadota bacterium]MDQ5945092.1 hypothetical protein [Pseudomonadota bacterium]